MAVVTDGSFCALDDTAADDPPPTAAGVTVRVDLQTDDTDPPLRQWLARQLRTIARIAGVRRGHLNILVVDDALMADMHYRYGRVRGTTDVLTFDTRDSHDAAATVEGDIVVCMDEARRQAAVRKHDIRVELLLYAVHGMLHLQGYDDHTQNDYRAMHEREDELFVAAGFEAVFAPRQRRVASRAPAGRRPNVRQGASRNRHPKGNERKS